MEGSHRSLGWWLEGGERLTGGGSVSRWDQRRRAALFAGALSLLAIALSASMHASSGVVSGGRRTHAIEAMQFDMHPYVAALGEEGRQHMRDEMEQRSKTPKEILEDEVKVGEAADAALHRLPLDTSKVDTSLWKDVPSRCRGHTIRSSTYTSISGDAQQFPLARVECPYSKSGCCSSPPEDDFPNAPTGFLGASAGETPMTDDLSGVSYIALAFPMLTGTLRMLC
jgi:hypothetical protein